MEKNAKQYREERADVLTEMEAMAEVVKNEKRAFSQEELDKYDALDQQQSMLEASAKSVERIEKLGSYVKQSQERPIFHAETRQKITAKDVDLAFRAFALANTEIGVSDDMRRAADKLGLNLNSNTFQVKFEQTVADGTEGGYLTNDSIFSGLETAMKSFGGIRSVSNVLRTGTGETIHIATVDDTANVGVIHTENATVANVDLVFARTQLSAYSVASGVYPVSYELMQDSQFPLGPYVGERLGERLARKKGAYLATGTGSSQPQGITVISTEGSIGITNAIVADDLYDLYFSVDAAYRNSPSCAWVMHDSTLSNIVSLEDTTGRPLWGSGLNQAPGSFLLGKPVVICNDMPEMAAGFDRKVIEFGDWSKFYVREAGPVQVQRLNERYAQELAVGFLAYERYDSKLIDAGQNPIKHMLATDSGS
jgi:HK97 family phage major capsid protein